jgi:hypothetical protein
MLVLFDPVELDTIRAGVEIDPVGGAGMVPPAI